MTRGKFDRFMVDVHIGANRKIRRLTPAERWCHVAGVLAIAAQAPIRGRLLVGQEDATPVDYAETAGVNIAVARSAIEKLRNGGLIVPDDENNCEMVHDWQDCNPEPKRDKTAKDRMRRFRERRRNQQDGNAGVTDRNALAVTAGREGKVKEEVANAPSSSSDADRIDEKANEDDKRLCRLLGELAKERNPKFKVRSRSRWLTDMRLLRERDKNSPDEIELLLRWVFTDKGRDATFWADVIRSPGNLREHFAQLWGKMQAQPLHAVGAGVEDSDAFLTRRGVA